MEFEAVIQSKQRERRELQRLYAHAAERKWELRTRMIAPEKEPMRRKLIKRYELECKTLCEQINELGDEIYKLQIKERESK